MAADVIAFEPPVYHASDDASSPVRTYFCSNCEKPFTARMEAEAHVSSC